MWHVRLEASGQLGERLLILDTGLQRGIHLFGERQSTEQKPYRENSPTDDEKKRLSIINLHTLSLALAPTNVNLLVLRQTCQNPGPADLVEALVLTAGLRQGCAGPQTTGFDIRQAPY